MTPLTTIILGIVFGLAAMIVGIGIVFTHYLKLRTKFEQRVLQAEKELIEDIMDGKPEELLKTSAGRQLLSSIDVMPVTRYSFHRNKPMKEMSFALKNDYNFLQDEHAKIVFNLEHIKRKTPFVYGLSYLMVESIYFLREILGVKPESIPQDRKVR